MTGKCFATNALNSDQFEAFFDRTKYFDIEKVLERKISFQFAGETFAKSLKVAADRNLSLTSFLDCILMDF